jgi:hypothetical protein
LQLGPISSSLKNSGVIFTPGGGHDFVMNVVWVTCLLPIVFLAPNTQQIMSRFRPALDQRTASADSKLSWRPNLKWAVFMSVIFAAGLLSLTRPSEFLYFQF